MSSARGSQARETAPLDALGHEVRRLRERVRVSQGGLADALGIDASFLSRIERGKAKAPKDFVGRLMKVDALALTADDEMKLSGLLGTSRPFPDPLRVLQAIDLTQSILSGAFGPRVLYQMTIDPRAKRTIARYLAGELANLTRVNCRFPLVLDSGTTVAFIAHALSEGPDRIGDWDFYTSNLLASLYLVDSGQVYLLGGRLDSGFGATLGSETIRQTRVLLKKLNAEDRRTCNPSVGVLSCLAFDPSHGPYARLAFTDSGKPRVSAHAKLKGVFLETIPYLIIPITPEKLLRPEDRHWKPLISPVQQNGRDSWEARLEKKSHFTHVVMTLGRESVRHREIVLRTCSLLASRVPSFKLTEALFDPGESEGGNAFLTVLDETSGVALLAADLWP